MPVMIQRGAAFVSNDVSACADVHGAWTSPSHMTKKETFHA